jgi:hypothetical protein
MGFILDIGLKEADRFKKSFVGVLTNNMMLLKVYSQTESFYRFPERVYI